MIHRVDHSGQAQNAHISCSPLPVPRGPENAKGWLQKRSIFGECARPPGFFLGAFDLVKRYFEEQHRL